MIKLIAIDLDGTLLNSQKKISIANKQAIKEARQKGIHVIVCTGRPIKGVKDILVELDLVSEHDYVITFNGGLIQISATEEVLSAKGHTQEDVLEIYEECTRVGLPINPIDVDYVYTSSYPSHNPSLYDTIAAKSLVFSNQDWHTFLSTHLFNKVVSCCPEHILDERMALFSDTFKERFNLLKSRPILLEILPKEVDKSYGLKEICRILKIAPQEVMAIGDEENDLAMIAFAGYGVAMGNATTKVKSTAKYITCTNDEDGVAHAIRQYAL
ncbi:MULTISPECIES: Cof-type HAD-IIB family hydrolase [unclassified Granulicatella]|uniref:Cof-type HAD-IIB family hydrolase n=1 Tax=unclassified Granulicatella TaxID=2630493 RepID=UPI001074808D|nr:MULTISPECIES: Cof-type HAD-IIB family hydrolase [unclassified Granulicatella]MBF0780820.1 HAD family phosphatase [Granulicatella sp. 19428wC4_WM01]TFU93806.1 HAD family phosphatase [Granulicatella sp. WM01]